MFTGIISYTGKLYKKNNLVFSFKTKKAFCKKIKKGSSISINGACLTVFRQPANQLFSVQLMPETLQKTMLGQLKPGGIVNLELPLSAKELLAGHIVQGHVDGIGTIQSIQKDKNSWLLDISITKKVAKYIAEKGSVAVNGISLTVIKAQKTMFSVGIIPYTWKYTMLQQIKVGDQVNIEVDIIAKYLERLVKSYQK